MNGEALAGHSAGPSFASRAWTVLRWFAAIALLAYLLYQNVYLKWDQLRPVLARGVNWWAIGGAGLAYVVALLINSYRWYLLVRAQEFEFDYVSAVQLNVLGTLFNYVAPGSIGGDVVKGALIAKRQQTRRLVVASTVLLDRALGMLALFIVGFVAYLSLPAVYHTDLFAWAGRAFAVGAAIGLGGLVIALVPGFTTSDWVLAVREWPYVGRAFQGVLETVRLYQQRWRVVIGCLAIGFVTHTLLAASVFLASQSLSIGSAVPIFRAQTVVMCASNFGAAFIPTPGGVGAFEAALAAGFEIADRRQTSGMDFESTPPDWKASLVAVRADTDRTREIAEEYDLEASRFDESLTALSAATDASVSAALNDDVAGIPAGAVRSAYQSGHGLLTYRTGLLAGLVYRILTILAAVLGGFYYLASRREIDAVIDEVEHPDANSPSTA